MAKNKTYFRELAGALLLFLCVLAYQEKENVLEILAVPFTTFAIAAFTGKLVSNGVLQGGFKPLDRGRPSGGSEHSGREGE